MSDHNHIRQYGDRLDAAREAVKTALPSETASTAFLNNMRDKVNAELSAKFKEGMSHLEDQEEVLDCMEFAWGQPPAENFAREQGITDETVLAKVREFGFHQAALWIQLRVENERDMSADEAKRSDGHGFSDDFDY